MSVDAISHVHVVYKTHLDVGFTDFAREIVANYFTQYIPQAITLAQALREEGSPDRFVWTTGSWLIYEYLEQASPEDRERMEQALLAGDIVWHGLPFTTHSELMDASLFRAGLQLSQELDRRFGRTTIAAKMTDVPGHTRAIVPLLAEAGIQFLHIGVNPASTPPDVPPVFIWRHTDGSEVVVMYHKGSYGATMTVPGMTDAIAFAHTGDNHGPQSIEEIHQGYRALREQFPTATVAASTLDEYAGKLLQIKSTLPVITDELGDSWIHGVGSDPAKVSQFRALCRLRQHWLTDSEPTQHPGIAAFSRKLLLIPEHTWGMDEKTFLGDCKHYSRKEFTAMRATEEFRRFADSWQEQRDYLAEAITALDDEPLIGEAEKARMAVAPSMELSGGFVPVDPGDVHETSAIRVKFDSQTGALIGLCPHESMHEWASPQHPLGLFRYQTFSQQDYNRFWQQYLQHMEDPSIATWAAPDFTKPGIYMAGAVSAWWLPTLLALSHREADAGDQFLAELAMPEEPVRKFGCPAYVTMLVELPRSTPEVRLTLQWFDKAACRLPEAMWCSFQPIIADETAWSMDKMGQPISPFAVVRNGNRCLHAVQSAVTYAGHDGRFGIDTLDTPLVAPGEPALLNFTQRRPPLKNGMHFNLYNNVWGTNFPMWYEEDGKSRFVLRFS
ncbi:MAG TPA: DUF5054 domain-containing protein [Armatimonadota bacterium]|nr:DUF5054 domain-containing protein [Armatimonadota bacterium]